MVLMPAIDIKDGACVRLLKGEFDTVHKVAGSTQEAAQRFQKAGAEMIHVVDLDGALNGCVTNWRQVEIILGCGMQVELGGGIRDMETIERCVEAGVARVILGSAALRDPALVREAAAQFGERLAVGIDAKDGFVSVDGWTAVSNIPYLEFAKKMEETGVKTLIFTDISKDGTLEGPNFTMLQALAEAVSCQIVASGGVRDIGHIRALRDMGLYGAIAGKAVYSGTLDLQEAIALCKGE